MYFKPEFTEIHHLSYNNVRNQPQFPEVWQTVIEPFIKNKDGSETIFIAHNAKFDMGVLRACFNYYGMPVPSIEYKCTLNISRRVWKDLKWHKLTYLAEQFEIIVGAVLTQNTSWPQVETSINNLKQKIELTPEKLLDFDENEFKLAIKPSGYFNQKYDYLRKIKVTTKMQKHMKKGRSKDWEDLP